MPIATSHSRQRRIQELPVSTHDAETCHGWSRDNTGSVRTKDGLRPKDSVLVNDGFVASNGPAL